MLSRSRRPDGVVIVTPDMANIGGEPGSSFASLSRCGGRISRPTMSSAMAASDSPAELRVETRRPSRNTVTRSAAAFTSLSLWVMKRMVRPEAFS